MPTLRACAEDKSWRVRYMVADKFTELQVQPCHQKQYFSRPLKFKRIKKFIKDVNLHK